MLQKAPLIKKDNNQNVSWLKTKNPLVSKTLTIYANALNSCLCISPARSFPCVNLSSRLLNLEGFSGQKGYRNPLANVSYTQTYKKFLEALHLVALIRQKGGRIYIVFDGDQYRPPFSFLHSQRGCNEKRKVNSVEKLKSSNYKASKEQSTFFHKPRKAVTFPLEESKRHFINKGGYLNSTLLEKLPSISLKKPLNLLENKGEITNISWSSENWVAGTFSNFLQVSKSISLYKTLSRQFLEILENQTSPRYFLMARKFHGNLFFSKKKSSGFYCLAKFPASHLRHAMHIHPEHALSKDYEHATSTNTKAVSRAFLAEDERKNLKMQSEEVSQVKRKYAFPNDGTLTKQNSNYSKKSSYSKSRRQAIVREKSCLKYKNLPDLIVIENAEKYKNVIAEAENLKIPIIAFVESDILSDISIALPINALKHYFLTILLYIVYKIPRN